MQAAGLLKEKNANIVQRKTKVKLHTPMAKPELYGTITQENSDRATLIEESKDGMGFITTRIKLPSGKNAWKDKEDSRKAPRKRITSRNKVGDSSQIEPKGTRGAPRNKQQGVVNVLLYVGFFLMSLGLIITFVGMGERGFKTKELQLIGPSLIGSGILFTLLRILFCSFSSFLCERSKPQDKRALLSPSMETLVGGSSVQQTALNSKATSVQDMTKAQPEPITTQPSRSNYLSPARAQPPTSIIDDEIESDTDLGLSVQYIKEDYSIRNIRNHIPETAKSSLTQIENVERREQILSSPIKPSSPYASGKDQPATFSPAKNYVENFSPAKNSVRNSSPAKNSVRNSSPSRISLGKFTPAGVPLTTVETTSLAATLPPPQNDFPTDILEEVILDPSKLDNLGND